MAVVRTDEIVAQVAELLGTDTAGVDPTTDLVRQGFDSIRMMTLAGRWRSRGLAVDFAALAADPRVSAWAALLEAADPSAARGWADDAEDSAGADDGGPAYDDGADGAHGADGADDAEYVPFPLAPMQHALWVGRQAGQQLGGVAGHLYVEFDSEPDGVPVDPDLLAAAAEALAARHPMLRVVFLPDGTQRIDSRRLPVTVHDLSGNPETEARQRLAELRRSKSHQQLDDAVLELSLSIRPDRTTRLHVDLDMQAADAMSYRTLMADLAAAYRGEPLAQLDFSYRRYRDRVADHRPDPRHRDWWAQRIPDLPDPPALPRSTGVPADAARTTRRWHWLDPETRDALFGQARQRGITPAMALAGAFAHTLARWSAQPRFLLNVPLFGREPVHPDVDRLVGDFTSSLLLDIDLGEARTGTERAHRVQDALRAAAAHGEYAGLSVLRDLSRHRGSQVLAPVVFTSALGLGELFAPAVTEAFGRPAWIISQGPQVLLDAQVTEFAGGVLINWDVREEMFPPGVIDAMFAHHLGELARLTGDGWETAAPAALPPAQVAVRAAVNGVTATASGETLQHGFFRQASLRPDAPAIRTATGEVSYRTLREQTSAVADALRARGVTTGDTVALLGPKCAEQIPALLGILAAGGCYLPVGAEQPADRTRTIVDLGRATAALVTGASAPTLDIPTLVVRDLLAHRDSHDPSTPAPDEPSPVDPEQLAYVVFTSGSTGEPKGVEVSHAAAMNTVEALTDRFAIGPDDRSLALLGLDADMSVLDVFAVLRAGGTIVMVDEADRRSPDVWAQLVDAHRVSLLNLMPGALQMLLTAAEAAGVPRTLSSVRTVLTGGDWVPAQLVRRFRERVPGVRFAGLGGATETAIHATVCEVDGAPPVDWATVPYGTPLPNMHCRVVDTGGNDRPDWVTGELWVGGRGIARGYRGRPDLTAERFVEHDGRIWYRTGDLARYHPDGTCEFVGRADHRVKVSGYRIELGEVEAALRRLPGVADAVAAVLPAEHGGVLAAAVQPSAGAAGLTVPQLRDLLADSLPEHMIPRRLQLVETIRYTGAGKVDRRAVTAELAALEGDDDRSDRQPATALQRAVAMIVADVLGVDRVGVDDDFFALGGDSVLATTVIARIRTWLDAPRAVVADVFAARTVAALADRLAAVDTDRLEQVAEVYLEVAQLDSAEVALAVGDVGQPVR